MKKILFRHLILMISFLVFAILLATAPSTSMAGEHRHYNAHVHGIAHLNAAVEGPDLHLEFTSPAANIVGFEHHPRTPQQKDAVRKATEILEDGSALFVPSPEAQCRLSNSSVMTDIEHDAGHDEDADHEKEHAHEAQEHHEKGEDHGHGHHEASEDEHAHHSEFEAEYRFVCQHPEKLSQVDVMLMQAFPGIEHIEAQMLTETKQFAQELTRKKSVLKW